MVHGVIDLDLPATEVSTSLAARKKKPSKPNRTGVALQLYISAELRATLDRVLAKTRRSLTTEVVIALENHFRTLGEWPLPADTPPDADPPED